MEKYKARLVAKDYKKKHEVDNDEGFAPFALIETIHLLISLAAQMKWRIYQLDMKYAGYLEE